MILTRWEYLWILVSSRDNGPPAGRHEMDTAGEQGWELVTVTTTGWAILKRELVQS